MGKKNDDVGNDSGSTVVTMTQDSLDGLFTARATRAANSAIDDLLKKLGFENEEAAISGLADLRAKSETSDETHQQELDDLKGKLKTAEGTIDEMKTIQRGQVIEREVLTHLGTFGFVEGAQDDVLAVFAGELPEGVEFNEEEAKVTGVKEALEKLAEQKPHWTVPQGHLTRTPGQLTHPPAQGQQQTIVPGDLPSIRL